MTKIKKLICIYITVTFIFASSACSPSYSYGGDLVKGVDTCYVFLNAGEKIAISVDEILGDDVQDIEKIEIISGNKKVLKTKGNEILGVGTGISYADTTIYTKNEGAISITIQVYVVNPDEMIEIRTPQDLVDIGQNLEGAYILKNDIDLNGYENWSSIGTHGENSELGDFHGILINPDGYKIKNLTINSIGDHPDLQSHDLGVGLFDTLFGAYVDGLILEDVMIDTSAYENNRNLSVGGICGYSIRSVIRNCSVDGIVNSQSATEKIAGTVSGGIIDEV